MVQADAIMDSAHGDLPGGPRAEGVALDDGKRWPWGEGLALMLVVVLPVLAFWVIASAVMG